MKLSEKEFAEIRGQLYPMLMDVAQIEEKGQGQMVNGAIASGLFAIYAVEQPGDKVQYVTLEDLRDWGISHTTLHVTAIQNLERLTAGKRVIKIDSPDGGRPMFIWHVEDGYDAARILLPRWLEDFAAAVPGGLVVGVPHRNWLVAIGDEDPQLVGAVRRRVRVEHAVAGFPVSPDLYRWQNGRLELYEPAGRV